MAQPRWQFVVGPATGGHELALTEARSRQYTVRLTEPSALSCGLDARHPQADSINELATDMHILWTGSGGTTLELDRQRIGSTHDSGTATEHTVDVTAIDYRAVLARRRLYTGDTVTYTGVDQGEIAWGLVSSTQGNTGGDLGISKAWTGTAPTGVNRDRTFELGDSVGERIQELSEVQGGFDWDVEPSGASALRLNVFYPERGQDRGVVLIPGGLVADWTREFNPADYANAIRMTGETALLAQEREAPDLAARAEGRWDAAFGDTGLVTQAALNERADWQIAQSQDAAPVWTVTIRQGGWDGPSHIWVGDTVRLVVNSGRLATDRTLRVYEMAFSIGEDGQESLTLALGGPKPDFRKPPALFARRLTNLERR